MAHVSVSMSSATEDKKITVGVTAGQTEILQQLVWSSLSGLYGFDLVLRS